MKNSIFILLSFTFFITSCTKDFVEPIGSEISSVSVRSQPVQITGTIASYEVGIDDIEIHLVDWDNSPEGLTPIQVQNLVFSNNGGQEVNVLSQTISVEVGIDDIEIHLVVPNDNLSDLTLLDTQTLEFN